MTPSEMARVLVAVLLAGSGMTMLLLEVYILAIVLIGIAGWLVVSVYRAQ